MANAQRVTYFKAGLKDQPGALLGIMQDLKSKNISLRSIWGFVKSEGNADLFVIPKDPKKLKSLWTASGLLVEEGTGFFLKGTDKTGALVKTLEVLAKANMNIKAIKGIVVGGKYGVVLWFDAADVEKAAQVLGAK